MLLLGLILFGLGLGGTIITSYNILSNPHLSFSGTITETEQTLVIILLLSILALFLGIMFLIFAIVKNKNQNKLDQINNLSKSSMGQGVCKNCGLSISANCDICPKCGTKQK